MVSIMPIIFSLNAWLVSRIMNIGTNVRDRADVADMAGSAMRHLEDGMVLIEGKPKHGAPLRR